MTRRNFRCLTTLAAVLSTLAAGSAAGQVPPVGPPTYTADVLLDVMPGDGRPTSAHAVRASGWSSQGAPRATAGATAVIPSDLPSSEADATATAADLHATAIASGYTSFEVGLTPHYRASAQASTTNFFQNHAADTPLTFTPFLNGVLEGRLVFAELPGPIWTRMEFRLDIVDLAGQVTSPIFAVSARIDWIGYGPGMQWSTFASGATAAGVWDDAVQDVTPPGSGIHVLNLDVQYSELLEDAYIVPANNLFGVRWTLSAESVLDGTSVAAAMVADFGHTAHIGFTAPDGALTEVLVAPPVPEPATAWLLPVGLLLVLRRCRRRHAALVAEPHRGRHEAAQPR
jgi:hypothetical protein